MFGIKPEIAHDVYWDLFRDAKAGRKLVAGRRTDAVFSNLTAYAFPVAKKHSAILLGWSRWFYVGDDFPCLQIVWPDRTGLFPWDPGFDVGLQAVQPDLTDKGWTNDISD